MKKCFGVDVGGTYIKIGIFNLAGDLLEKWQIDTRIGNNGEFIFEDIANEIWSKAINYNILTSDIIGVGIGMPGPVRENGYIETCVNIGLKEVNASEKMRHLLKDIPVMTMNDANAAALGEMWQGGGKGYNNLVFVTLGTGVGSGIILNGKILFGERGLSGEIGHIVVNPDETEYCNCGAKGCLDQIASARGLVRHTKIMLENSHGDISAKDITEAAKSGDLVARASIEYCMRFLGKSLSDLGQVIDPQAFIIGGGLSNAGEFLLDIIQKAYDEYAKLSKIKPMIVLAKLGNDAGIYGTAKMMIDHNN